MTAASNDDHVCELPVLSETAADLPHTELDDAREQIINLRVALATSRMIGTAIGILMARYTITSESAFDMLRQASQKTHRKLRDVADDVVLTGTFEGDNANPSARPENSGGSS